MRSLRLVAWLILELSRRYPDEPFVRAIYNGLVERLLDTPVWRERYVAMVNKIAEEIMTPIFIDQLIKSAICRMQPDLLADPQKRSDNVDYLKRVDELGAFVIGRRKWLKAALNSP